MDEVTKKAAGIIEKLMRLAGSNPNEAEASAALEKAQQMLLSHNLSMAVIEQMSGQSGKRTDEQVRGGQHKYQRRLWHHIAELNFCMYWNQKNRVGPGTPRPQRYKGHQFVREHRLVGREVNVIATKNMGQYIGGTIDRLCEEKFLTTNYFTLTSSDAVAYREGIADRVIEKIADRRRGAVAKEKRDAADAAQKAAMSGVSSATAVTILGVKESEKRANYDFLNGLGAWDRKQKAEEEWEKKWAAHRAAQAKAEREAEAAYAKWAAANPEEARKEELKARRRDEAADRRSRNSPGRQYRFRETAEDMRRNSGSYKAGWEKGDSVSIDEQVDKSNQRRIK